MLSCHFHPARQPLRCALRTPSGLPLPLLPSQEPPISRVRLSGLAALRIIQYCKGFYPSTVTGQLLGMDAGEVLEVTDAFPFPSADAQDDDDGGDYHISMMRCLK